MLKRLCDLVSPRKTDGTLQRTTLTARNTDPVIVQRSSRTRPHSPELETLNKEGRTYY
jgi:hypothetical protein